MKQDFNLLASKNIIITIILALQLWDIICMNDYILIMMINRKYNKNKPHHIQKYNITTTILDKLE